eukprot:1195010-Prorocentrum_minimum.AAC.14
MCIYIPLGGEVPSTLATDWMVAWWWALFLIGQWAISCSAELFARRFQLSNMAASIAAAIAALNVCVLHQDEARPSSMVCMPCCGSIAWATAPGSTCLRTYTLSTAWSVFDVPV